MLEVLFPLGKTGGLIEALLDRYRRQCRRQCFRWVKPAASLKRRYGARGEPCGVHVFPLGKTGGLIEAGPFAWSNRLWMATFPLGKTGGLIEAQAACGERVGVRRGFRWVKPAASLKPRLRRRPSRTARPSFRWVKPAASLKLLRQYRTVFIFVPSFRWVKPAASLKLNQIRSTMAPYGKFPLGKTGGLIEAPRHQVRQRHHRHGFPLGKTGGLIEARRSARLACRGPPCFRWVKPAASLKPGHLRS